MIIIRVKYGDFFVYNIFVNKDVYNAYVLIFKKNL